MMVAHPTPQDHRMSTQEPARGIDPSRWMRAISLISRGMPTWPSIHLTMPAPIDGGAGIGIGVQDPGKTSHPRRLSSASPSSAVGPPSPREGPNAIMRASSPPTIAATRSRLRQLERQHHPPFRPPMSSVPCGGPFGTGHVIRPGAASESASRASRSACRSWALAHVGCPRTKHDGRRGCMVPIDDGPLTVHRTCRGRRPAGLVDGAARIVDQCDRTYRDDDGRKDDHAV